MSSSKIFPFQPKRDVNECHFCLPQLRDVIHLNLSICIVHERDSSFKGIPIVQINWITWAFPKHLMEGLSRHKASLIGHKNQAKFENDCISRSGHRFKITQPNSMILVSFSSAEDDLANYVKKRRNF